MEWSEGKVECLDLHKPSVVGQISDISSVDSPVAGEWDVRRSLPIRHRQQPQQSQGKDNYEGIVNTNNGET